MTRARDIADRNVDSTTIDGVDSTQLLRSDVADTKTAGDLSFADSVKAKFGGSGDLEIYHDGNHSYINDTGTGQLLLRTTGDFVQVQTGTDVMAKFIKDGAVELYYDAVKKFETTSDGTKFHGDILIEDPSTSSSAPYLEIIGKREDGNDSYPFAGKVFLSVNRTDALVDSGKVLGTVAFGGNHTDSSLSNILYGAAIHGESEGDFNSATDMPTALTFFTGSTGRDQNTANVDIGTERLRITSGGDVQVKTGHLELGDSQEVRLGDGDDLKIYHDSSTNNSVVVETGGGDLYLAGQDVHLRNSDLSERYLVASPNGPVRLYHDNSEKLATTSTGIDITGGFTATDGCTITTADNDAQLSLVSTDADSNFGPKISLYRNSASPADDDFLGIFEFDGENDAGETITYAQLFGRAHDVTDGTEDGRVAIKVMRAGTLKNVVDIIPNEIVFNQDSQNIDLRVESDGNENMLFVDAANDRVGIGISSPDQTLHVRKGDAGGVDSASSSVITVENNSDAYIQFLTPNTASQQIRFGDPQDNGIGILSYSHSDNSMRFNTAGPEKMRIDSNGNLLIGATQQAGPDGGNGTGLVLAGNGRFYTSTANGGNVFEFNINGTGGVGSINVSGSSTSYNTSSDHRLKENVADMAGAIDRVKQLAPKRFNFIRDANTTVDGFLAHEAQAVVPEAVTGTHNEVDEDGNAVMQGIDQSKLVPLLTGALQEAIAKIEALETSNSDLASRIAALEA